MVFLAKCVYQGIRSAADDGEKSYATDTGHDDCLFYGANVYQRSVKEQH